MNELIKKLLVSIILCTSSQIPLLSMDGTPVESPEAKRRKLSPSADLSQADSRLGEGKGDRELFLDESGVKEESSQVGNQGDSEEDWIARRIAEEEQKQDPYIVTVIGEMEQKEDSWIARCVAAGPQWDSEIANCIREAGESEETDSLSVFILQAVRTGTLELNQLDLNVLDIKRIMKRRGYINRLYLEGVELESSQEECTEEELGKFIAKMGWFLETLSWKKRHFTVGGGLICSDKCAEIIANSKTLQTHLKTLFLESNTLTHVGVKVLVDNLVNLTRLTLRKCEEIDDDAAEAIANSKLRDTLETLSFLDGGRLTHVGVKAIADKLVNLKELSLTHNDIGDKGAEAIAEGNLRNLAFLVLEDIGITSLGVQYIADSANLPALAELRLLDCVDDEGVKFLANGEIILQRLVAKKNKITSVGLEAIAKGKLGGVLSYLDLRGHSIGPSIKDLSNMRSLRHLYLKNNEPSEFKTKILAGGAKIIADSGLSLETLDLEWNNIGDEGVSFIAGSTLRDSLKNLNLACNLVTHEGVATIAQNMVSLRHLNLSFNDGIKDQGGTALAKGELRNLEDLRLVCVFMTTPGLKDIISSHNFPKLQRLDLSRNKFGTWDGNEGAEVFMNGAIFSTLNHLDLGCCCGIAREGAQAIASRHPNLDVYWEEVSY